MPDPQSPLCAADDEILNNPLAFSKGVPHALFDRLRKQDPVHWTKGRFNPGFWSVTRRKDVEAILLDTDNFSSEIVGNHLPETEDINQLMTTMPAVLGCGALIVRTDPPAHRKLRSVLDQALSRRVVARFEPAVRELVVETIEASAARGHFDFVQDIALPIPLRAICQIMGVPAQDQFKVMRWTEQALFQAEADFRPATDETESGGFEQLSQYGLALALARRTDPRDDVTSVLAAARIDGEFIPDDILKWNVAGFIMGGLETTRNALSGGVPMLLGDEAQMARLRDDPELLNRSIEEILRYSSPITHVLRTATRDIEFRGRPMKAGDWIVCWLASANRDEDFFGCPHQIDVARQPNRHSVFGHGVHFCVGRWLATMEIRIVIEEMMRRLPHFEPDGPVSRVSSYIGAGFKRMPLRVVARKPG